MRTLPLCILTFALGCALTALVMNRNNPPAAAEVARVPAAPPPGPDAVKSKIAANGDKPVNTHADEASRQAKDVTSGEAGLGTKEASVVQGIGAFVGMMGPLMEASMKDEARGKADKLAARLKLSPEQRESLLKMLEAQGKEQADRLKVAIEAMKNTPNDLSSLKDIKAMESDPKAALAAWAKDKLSPDQQENLQRYQEDRRKANAEQSAQFQLDQINEFLDLDESQRDRLFQHFAKDALANGSAGDDMLDDSAMFGSSDTIADVAVESGGKDPAAPDPLAEILTPEQMATYKEHQENEEKRSLEMMESLGLDPAVFGGKEGDVDVKVRVAPTVIKGK